MRWIERELVSVGMLMRMVIRSRGFGMVTHCLARSSALIHRLRIVTC